MLKNNMTAVRNLYLVFHWIWTGEILDNINNQERGEGRELTLY